MEFTPAMIIRGEEKSPPLIFLHGFPFDATMWSSQIDYFKDRFYCVAPHLRGLGDSTAGDGQYVMETLVDDLFQLIDTHSLQKPVLCGFSMGGYVALRALERDQERFRGVVLCNTRATADDNGGKLKRAAGISQINREGTDSFVEDFLGSVFTLKFRREQRDKYEQILSNSRRFSATGLKGGLLAMLARTDTTSFLSQIRLPALLVGGRFDTVTPPDGMREMSRHMAGSLYEEAPEAGHMSPVESPEFVNEVMDRFLRERVGV